MWGLEAAHGLHPTSAPSSHPCFTPSPAWLPSPWSSGTLGAVAESSRATAIAAVTLAGPSEPLSFRGRSLYPPSPSPPHPPQQLCPPFSWCWGGHLRVGRGASPLPSAVQVTPPPAWSAAYSCSDLRATGTRWAEGLHSPGPRPPAIPFLVQPRPRQASPVIKTD